MTTNLHWHIEHGGGRKLYLISAVKLISFYNGSYTLAGSGQWAQSPLELALGADLQTFEAHALCPGSSGMFNNGVFLAENVDVLLFYN